MECGFDSHFAHQIRPEWSIFVFLIKNNGFDKIRHFNYSDLDLVICYNENSFWRWQKMENKKQINRTVVVVCGVLLGILLIAFGVYQNMNSEYTKLNIPTAEKLQEEIKNSYQEIDNLRKEILDEYEKNGETAEYRVKSRQIQEKEANRANLEERLLKINKREYDNIKNEAMGKSMPLFIGGILVIVTSLIVSGVLFSIEQKQKKK